MDSKNLLLRIIQLKPNITTFHLVKLAYLFDLACVQVFGEPKTGFPYKWHLFGPYCNEIEQEIWDLELEGRISIKPHTTKKNQDCFLHSPVENQVPNIGDTEEKVVRYVVRHYGRMKYEDLKDFVYSTPPMKELTEKNARFHELNMTTKKGIPEVFFDREMALSILNADKTNPKRTLIPLVEAWKKMESA